MDRTGRLNRIQQLLASRRVVSRDVFLRELGVSRATFKRDLEYLRERLMAPIIWDRDAGGYRMAERRSGQTSYQLPGLWLSSDELYALLAIEQLLSRIEPRLLRRQLGPLRAGVRKLIEAGDHSLEEFESRVRLQGIEPGAIDAQLFQALIAALLHRRRLSVEQQERRSNSMRQFEVSPQRLVHSRERWYLDAWCHEPAGLRSFPLDAMVSARLIDRRAREITAATLDAELGAGYGIFVERKPNTAVLKFSPQCARRAAADRWHPDQQGAWELDGGYSLQVPFGDPRELVPHILAYGEDVVVLRPPKLRAEVRKRLKAAAAAYRGARRR
ncbi:MAG: helix-turn-helix transcriptional regulator [Gammaproteobacteria bacterium]